MKRMKNCIPLCKKLQNLNAVFIQQEIEILNEKKFQKTNYILKNTYTYMHTSGWYQKQPCEDVESMQEPTPGKI